MYNADAVAPEAVLQVRWGHNVRCEQTIERPRFAKLRIDPQSCPEKGVPQLLGSGAAKAKAARLDLDHIDLSASAPDEVDSRIKASLNLETFVFKPTPNTDLQCHSSLILPCRKFGWEGFPTQARPTLEVDLKSVEEQLPLSFG